jgi:hypothetical protein
MHQINSFILTWSWNFCGFGNLGRLFGCCSNHVILPLLNSRQRNLRGSSLRERRSSSIKVKKRNRRVEVTAARRLRLRLPFCRKASCETSNTWQTCTHVYLALWGAQCLLCFFQAEAAESRVVVEQHAKHSNLGNTEQIRARCRCILACTTVVNTRDICVSNQSHPASVR